MKVGVYTVDIALGVAGSVVSDIVAYEVTLVDFATSEKITAQFAFNSTDQVKRISKLKPFTKYNINVRFYYLDGTKGARIPDRQFRTRECSELVFFYCHLTACRPYHRAVQTP